MTTCLYRSRVLDQVPLDGLLLFWRFLAWNYPNHRRDRTVDALKRRVMAVQYLPYKGDVSYLNMVIDDHFEKLGKKDIWRLLDAHGSVRLAANRSVTDMRNLFCQHLFGGRCADALQIPVRQIPVGCLDHLNEHAFNDRVMSKTFAV